MATNGKAAIKRTRQPSPFTPQVKVTVSTHENVGGTSATTAELGSSLESYFKSKGFATRAVSRSRKGSGPNTIPSLMIYVAPQGHVWTATPSERGVRLDAETAKLLRGVAESMGLDANDPQSIIAVAKALATKASQGATTVNPAS